MRAAPARLPTALSIVSARALDTIPAALASAPTTFVAASIDGLPRALEAQAARPRVAALSVDLIGHSTRDHHLLRLGATVIDALDLGVMRFFEAIARSGVLRELNTVCLRLLGCETARSPSGQRTMRLLASALAMPVHGTRKIVARAHYTELGFRPMFQHILVAAPPRRTPSLLQLPRSMTSDDPISTRGDRQ